MIDTKKKLKSVLLKEKKLYISDSKLSILKSILTCSPKYKIWTYVKTLRKTEYYFRNRNKNLIYMILYIVSVRKKNKLSLQLGIDNDNYVFDEGLMIYHANGIVVNGDAKVGKNCILHGNNVIGNLGVDKKAPIIGDNVRLGTGSKVLGDVYIADNVQIGAGAVVLHSCDEKGALLVGVPARIKRSEKNYE